MSKKVFVEVDAHFETDGSIVPFLITWEDGCKFEIDRITDVRRAASLKVGGQGTRYTCRIKEKTAYLFNEIGRWFVEAKE
ncbi:MAG: hypothetical protein RR911_04765 [Oscillospiraceae bacterium]